MNGNTENIDRRNLTVARWRNGPLKHQAENFRLLRALQNVGQALVVQKLRIRNQSAYSSLENGKTELGQSQARLIEDQNSLPEGWLNRNNAEMLFLSNMEFELISKLRKSDPQATSSMVAMLKHLCAD